MPCINRIRVNNVKYNFGTQQYDDFSMRMYGKNTLYDLANGGGKSVLMLLLLQNLIPNCTLDDKQPIEKLFRNGGGNTTIHSLIEWKLDDADIKDGYRYMTTGFCARKAKESDEGASQDGQTAAIEYFNYCIFYRDYNKNDIINLPLSNGNERITYSGLKSYIKELGHKDMSLEVRLFERKGEYQRFISEYGLHESHWEIIRGINKTEGHVRTYFETNYKTTRKVVEDLLIEEIIEKAFLTRTGRDGDESTMAETLLDIKDKLNVLAQKKRDIANFDHQIELINVLQAKVNSCINQYEAHEDITRQLADIYVTGKELTSRENEHLEELLVAKQTAFEQKESQKKRLENLKITRDGFRLQELRDKSEQLNANLAENERQVSALKQDMNMKESINDYLGYLEDKKQLSENQKIIVVWFVCRILQFQTFMADVPDVTVTAVRMSSIKRKIDTVCLTVCNLRITGIQLPFRLSPYSDNLDVRCKGFNRKLETELVISLTCSTVADSNSTLFTGYTNKLLSNKRSCK